MEWVQADGGVRAVLLNRAQDPLGAIAADVGELGTALWAKVLEEALHHFLAAAFGRPDQPTPDVIDDQCHVALASTPTDLVDADALQAVQTVVRPRGLLHHAGDDPAHRLPVQPHQLAARFLRALRRQPGDLILEGTQKAATMARPGHSGDHHAVLATADAGCRCLHDRSGWYPDPGRATSDGPRPDRTADTADRRCHTAVAADVWGAREPRRSRRVPRPGAPARCLPHPESGAIHSDQARRLPSTHRIEHRNRSGRRRASPLSGGLADGRQRAQPCVVRPSPGLDRAATAKNPAEPATGAGRAATRLRARPQTSPTP